MTGLWMLFLSLLVTIHAASLGPKPVDIPVAIVYDGLVPIAREVPVNNDVGVKHGKVVKKQFAPTIGLKNLQERPQLSPEEIVESEQINIPEFVAKFAIGNDVENQPLTNPIALDDQNVVKTVPNILENVEQSSVSLDAGEQTDDENNVSPSTEKPADNNNSESSEESNESNSSEEETNNVKVDETSENVNNIKENETNQNENTVKEDEGSETANNEKVPEKIQQENENPDEIMIAQEDSSVKIAELPQLQNTKLDETSVNKLETEVPQESPQVEADKEEVNVPLLRRGPLKNEETSEVPSTTKAPTTQRPIKPFAGIQNVINRIGENALNILRPNANNNNNNNGNKPTANREGEVPSSTAAPPNLIESFQNNVNTQMNNFASNVQGFFDRFRNNDTQSDEGSPPSQPLLDAIETQFNNGFTNFQNTVNGAINLVNPNAPATGAQSDEPQQPPNAVIGAIQNGLQQFQQTFTNAVQNLRPNQTESDEGDGNQPNFPQQVMNMFQTSVQNFMSNFNPNRNSTQSDETTQRPQNPISSFFGAISNVFAGNQNPAQQVVDTIQNATASGIPSQLPNAPSLPEVPNFQEQLNQFQNQTGVSFPGNLEIPNPANISLPENLGLPNPANIPVPDNIPNPAEIAENLGIPNPVGGKSSAKQLLETEEISAQQPVLVVDQPQPVLLIDQPQPVALVGQPQPVALVDQQQPVLLEEIQQKPGVVEEIQQQPVLIQENQQQPVVIEENQQQLLVLEDPQKQSVVVEDVPQHSENPLEKQDEKEVEKIA